MPSYPFMQIHAFTDHPLGGNPCAVLLDCDDLDDGTMLAIAREMNLSQTAFICRSARADFAARYFNPAEEIPLAARAEVSRERGRRSPEADAAMKAQRAALLNAAGMRAAGAALSVRHELIEKTLAGAVKSFPRWGKKSTGNF